MDKKFLMSIVLGAISSFIFILVSVMVFKFINDNIHILHSEVLYIPGVCLIAIILLWQVNKSFATGVILGSILTFSCGLYWLSIKYPPMDVRDDIGNQFNDNSIKSVK